jgi:hypothetical protein
VTAYSIDFDTAGLAFTSIVQTLLIVADPAKPTQPVSIQMTPQPVPYPPLISESAYPSLSMYPSLCVFPSLRLYPSHPVSESSGSML